MCVQGILFLREKDIVVETKLRFCAKEKCVRNIKGTLSNIKEMHSDMKIKCSPQLKDTVTADEQSKLFSEGFEIIVDENIII